MIEFTLYEYFTASKLYVNLLVYNVYNILKLILLFKLLCYNKKHARKKFVEILFVGEKKI